MTYLEDLLVDPLFQVLFGTGGVLLIFLTALLVLSAKRTRRNTRSDAIVSERSKDVQIERNTTSVKSPIRVSRGKRVVIRDNKVTSDG